MSEEQKSTIHTSDVDESKRARIALIVGVVLAIGTLAIPFLGVPNFFMVHFVLADTILFWTAVILLFTKQYRLMGRKYLVGFFGSLVAIVFLSFAVGVILSLISQS